MCGIFGVRGHVDAPQIALLGLYSLQHRGQESVGVVSIDANGQARAVRSMGTLSDTVGQELTKLPGISAVGHTRYSTSGSSTIENAQPVVARSKGGYITLAHNGNLINAASCDSSSKSKDRSSRRRTTRKSSCTESRGRTPTRRLSVSPMR